MDRTPPPAHGNPAPSAPEGRIGIYVRWMNALPSLQGHRPHPITETKPQRENARLIAAAPQNCWPLRGKSSTTRIRAAHPTA